MHLLSGRSGDGKTTVFLALAWCLYGGLRGSSLKPVASVSHACDTYDERPACDAPCGDALSVADAMFAIQKFSAGPAATVVILIVDMPNGENAIVRRKAAATSAVEVEISGRVLKGDAATGWIEHAFGTRNLWMASSYLAQGGRNPILSLTNAEKFALLFELTFGTPITSSSDEVGTADDNELSPVPFIATLAAAASTARSAAATAATKVASARDRFDSVVSRMKNKVDTSEITKERCDMLEASAAKAAALVEAASSTASKIRAWEKAKTMSLIAKDARDAANDAAEKAKIALTSLEKWKQSKQDVIDSTSRYESAKQRAATLRAMLARAKQEKEVLKAARENVDRARSEAVRCSTLADQMTKMAKVSGIYEFEYAPTDRKLHIDTWKSVESFRKVLYRYNIFSSADIRRIATLFSSEKYVNKCQRCIGVQALTALRLLAVWMVNHVEETTATARRSTRQLWRKLGVKPPSAKDVINKDNLIRLSTLLKSEASARRRIENNGCDICVECPKCRSTVSMSSAKTVVRAPEWLEAETLHLPIKSDEIEQIAADVVETAEAVGAVTDAVEMCGNLGSKMISFTEEANCEVSKDLIMLADEVVANVWGDGVDIIADRIPCGDEIIEFYTEAKEEVKFIDQRNYEEAVFTICLSDDNYEYVSSFAFDLAVIEVPTRGQIAAAVADAKAANAASVSAEATISTLSISEQGETEMEKDIVRADLDVHEASLDVAKFASIDSVAVSKKAAAEALEAEALSLNKRAVLLEKAAREAVCEAGGDYNDDYAASSKVVESVGKLSVAATEAATLSLNFREVFCAKEQLDLALVAAKKAEEWALAGARAVRTISDTASKVITTTLDSLTSTTNAVLSDIFPPDTPMHVRLDMTHSATRATTNSLSAGGTVSLSILYRGSIYDGAGLLSGGENDRLSLALTIALSANLRCPFILLDECMSSLDDETQDLCFDAIRKYLPGKTVVNVSHSAVSGAYDANVTVVNRRPSFQKKPRT